MKKRVKVLTALCALSSLVVLGACSQSEAAKSGPSSSGPSSSDKSAPKLLWVGDSIAAQLAEPLAAAAKASGVPFKSIASTGGGNVSGRDQLVESTFESLNKALGSFNPDVVIYQVSTYDWGTEKEQRAAYQKLLKTVTEAGAQLVFVTMPPIKPDGFYADHMDELERTSRLVKEVAAGSDKAVALESSEVWGDSFQLRRNGKLIRKSDGIHTCPQGAARFTVWLLDELAGRYPGIDPAKPKSWANAGWAGDSSFKGC